MDTRTEPNKTKPLRENALRNPLICNPNRSYSFPHLANGFSASLAETLFHQIQRHLLGPMCCQKQLYICLIAIFLSLSLSACSSPLVQVAPSTAPDAPLAENRADIPQNRLEAAPDDSQVLEAQNNQAHKVEVLFSAQVKKLLPDDTKGLPHQRFLLQLSNGSTVLIAHDTKYAPSVPVQAGDTVTVKGEYIWNKRGGVVHWTHLSDTPRHEGGFIEFQGTRYQ